MLSGVHLKGGKTMKNMMQMLMLLFAGGTFLIVLLTFIFNFTVAK